jgi:hypothetical protein
VLAGLAVAAVPVGATAAPTDDHEPVALGERLDALLPQMTATLTEEEHARLWDMLKVVRAELGTENAIRACEEVWARGDAIHRAIIAGRAQACGVSP